MSEKRREVGVLLNVHRDEWVGLPALKAIINLPDEVLGFSAFSRYIGPRLVGPGPMGKLSVKQQISKRFDKQNPMYIFPGNRYGNSDQHFAWAATDFFATINEKTGEIEYANDLVIDIHGNKNKYNLPFYSSINKHNPLVQGVLSLLEADDALICEAPNPAGVIPNYAGWDLGVDSGELLECLPSYLERLCNGWVPPSRPMREWRHVGTITEVDAERLGLERDYPPFARLPDKAASILIGDRINKADPPPLHAIFCGADLYQTGFLCEVVTPYTPVKT